MMKLLQGPIVERRTEPYGRFGRQADVARTLPGTTRTLREGFRQVGEFTLGSVLGILILAVQLLLYMGAVLAVPLLPFLLILGAGPAVLLFGLVIVGASKLLAVFGLL